MSKSDQPKPLPVPPPAPIPNSPEYIGGKTPSRKQSGISEPRKGEWKRKPSMKSKEIKQKYIELLLDINIARLARRYFDRSSGWLYHKLDGIDGNGKETDFTPEELERFKGALCDLADRLRRMAAEI